MRMADGLHRCAKLVLGLLATATLLVVALMGGSLWWDALAHPLPAITVENSPKVFPWDRRWVVLGGPDHDVFLGCLSSCFQEDSEYIFAQMMPYGRFTGPHSIANQHSPYGTPHGPYSACDPAASNPPILVDEKGNVAGAVTLNAAIPGRIQNEWVIAQIEHLCELPTR